MVVFFLFLNIFLFVYIWRFIIRSRHVSPSPSTTSTLTTAQQQVIKYDVFLSFRGEDTRVGFTSHLHAALDRKQILTFIDDQLRRGDEISASLLRIIEEAKLSVIVFTENYASSKWCLEELAKIFERRKNNGQTVIPVFYQVDPSHVRNLTGSFGGAFARLMRNKALTLEKVQSFRDALTDAANLSGWSLGNSELESEFIENIVGDVMNKLHAMSSSHSTAGLFGIDVHLSKVESLLNMESPDVLIVGIWGMGGIGKTTIAEAVCNKVRSRFEGIFFANFRDKQSDLQRKFLKRLLGQETLNTMVSLSFRDSFVRDRLRRIKVFIVLDDVDDSMPLEEWRDLLDGRNSSFGPGSKVVITSRDKQVLRNVVDETYEVEGLNHEDAIQLFSSKALKNCIPTIDQRHLIEQIVRHAQGNPLTLKVLGSSLYGKSIEEWRSALNKLVLSLQTSLPTRVLLLFLRLFLHKTMAMFFLFLSIFLFFYIWIFIIRNRHISPSPSTPSTLATAQPRVPKYDVFLSFRGEDTRFDFTSHLYAALNRKQILTYIDYQLVRGDEIPPSLLIRTIEEAKLSVIVFTENYASSKWCLEELAKIFERRKNNGQIVIPVFYQVDPSHVRNQTGSFGNAFARLIKKKALTMDQEQSFRDALTDAATLSGWTLGNSDLESEFIEKIVGDVLNKLKVMSSSHSTALFGIDVRVNKVESLLKMESPDVLIVGIWGMGGTGKTTIAQAVCNKVRSRFEGILFANFRQDLGTGSMADLQRSFLSQLLGQEIRNMGSLSFRDSFVRERLRCKKVFIVLDDVDDVMRLEEWRDLLDGRNSLFGPGSKALITSRDKQVLNNVVDETYEVEGLNYEESLQLFS